MKKIFLFLILFGIPFIPSFVYASSSTSLQINYYPISDSGREYIFKWLNDTSNNYLDSKISDYDYYLVWVSTNVNNTYRTITLKMVLSNNIFYFKNSYGTGTGYGFGPRYTDTFNQLYVFTFYQPLGSNYFYSSSTNFTDTYKLSSLSDSLITSQQHSDTGIQFQNNYQFYYLQLSSDLTKNYSNITYMSNIQLVSNATRNLFLYNADTLEEITTINQNEVFPGYRELFFDKPSYLNGYKKITLPIGKQYLAISGINKGIIYVPTEAYASYNSFLMYYENGLEYQPYSNIITDTRITSDLQYVAITFDYSNLSNIDLVMFSKYDYLEGVDNISYDIYIPNNSYTDNVSVSPNSNGGNDFTFNYSDLNGNISSESFSNYSEDMIEKNQLFNALFETFSNNYFGLNAIISRPLDLIASLTSATCENIVLPLPYVNENITLPCMDSIYSTYFGLFYDIYQDLISGFICYWILIDLVRLVKGFKDPAYDKIEVVNL